MEQIPILKLGPILMVSIQVDLHDFKPILGRRLIQRLQTLELRRTMNQRVERSES